MYFTTNQPKNILKYHLYNKFRSFRSILGKLSKYFLNYFFN